MPMTDKPPGRFLMTPAQHREWARILHAKGKPEKAPAPRAARAGDRAHRAPAATAGADMMSTAREAPTFLLTPRQHRAWAERARRANRHDLAQHHEQLARAIERIERREAEHNADRVPPLSRAAQKSPA
jgi:hypothetical protein